MDFKCLNCNKKLRIIKSDKDYKNWNRKYHKNCYLSLEKKKKDEETIKHIISLL